VKRTDRFPGSKFPVLSPDAKVLEGTLDLNCKGCGKTAAYEVGRIFIAAPPGNGQATQIEDGVGFSAYFRCGSCGGGGPWGLPPSTLIRLIELLDRYRDDPSDSPIQPGTMLICDGTRIRYATEGEERLQRMISAEPESAFLWCRLGNLYRSAGRPDLAKGPYYQALQRDAMDVDSHYALGGILIDEGDLESGAKHFRQVLKHAWRKKGDLDEEFLRGMVRNVLEWLFRLNEKSEGKIEIFSPPDPSEIEGSSEDMTLEIRSLDVSSDSGWDELVDITLRETRPRFGAREIPERLFPSRFSARTARRVGAFTGAPRATTPARNALCPCASGRKFKNCCGR
jgi:hypothetical protein